jgi:hypothetical protein
VYKVFALEIAIFWVMTHCSLVGGLEHFEGMCGLNLHFSPEDGGSMFLQNIGNYIPDCVVSTWKTTQSRKSSLLWKPQNSYLHFLFLTLTMLYLSLRSFSLIENSGLLPFLGHLEYVLCMLFFVIRVFSSPHFRKLRS